MGKYRPITSKSRCVTVRFPVSELELIEQTAADHGISRHAIIRNLVTDAIKTGKVYDFAQSAKTPA